MLLKKELIVKAERKLQTQVDSELGEDLSKWSLNTLKAKIRAKYEESRYR